MPISNEQRKHFRTLGHALKPIVTIAGKGLSDSVKQELHRALEDHELIKVKLAISDRDTRTALLQELLTQTRAELIQEIGKIGVIFRAAKQQNHRLSNVRRAP